MRFIDDESKLFENEMTRQIAENNKLLEVEKDHDKIIELELRIETLFELRDSLIKKPVEKEIIWTNKVSKDLYYKRYYQKNKAKIRASYKEKKEYFKEYYENNKKKILERAKEYHKKNIEKKHEAARKYYQKNKEAINKKLRDGRNNER